MPVRFGSNTVYGSWSVRFVSVRVLRFSSVRGDTVFKQFEFSSFIFFDPLPLASVNQPEMQVFLYPERPSKGRNRRLEAGQTALARSRKDMVVSMEWG